MNAKKSVVSRDDQIDGKTTLNDAVRKGSLLQSCLILFLTNLSAMVWWSNLFGTIGFVVEAFWKVEFENN